ncbi:hypothetical protein [Aestuariispira insulae]|uniref:Uncharacterized protein n=1 Tax=Aestuariispira insulae TaxID=1461337 RepID=A0A3D9HRR3_9PROT|nr:hypothetical protein [Aestuariispira insulae]RED52187.1 hypothetical protein DFP90_102205 [Aestuariispira insulae]
MTVETENSTQVYHGDGESVSFAIPFYFLDKADLKIVRRLDDGTETTEVPQSVTGDGVADGGSLTLSSPLAAGQELHIIRWPAKTQLTRLVNANNLPPETVERLADRLLMLHQANWKQIEKAVRLPETYSGDALTIPEPPGEEALIGYDAAGKLVASTGFADTANAAHAAAAEAVAAASSVNNPLDKTQNLADLPDKEAAVANLFSGGLTSGVILAPKKNGDSNASFMIDHSVNGLQTLTITQNLSITPDLVHEGITELLFTNDGTGGYTIDSSTFTHSLEGDYNNAANARHHLVAYSVKDDAGVMVTWGYIKELGA